MNTQEAIETVRDAVKQCMLDHPDQKPALEQAWKLFEDAAMMSEDDVTLLFVTLNEKINILTRGIHHHKKDKGFVDKAHAAIDTYTKIMACVGAVPKLDEDLAHANGRMTGKMRTKMGMEPTVAMEIEHPGEGGAGPS